MAGAYAMHQIHFWNGVAKLNPILINSWNITLKYVINCKRRLYSIIIEFLTQKQPLLWLWTFERN